MKSTILTTEKSVNDVIQFASGFNEFAFDTETDGLSHDRRWIGLSFAVRCPDNGYIGWYIPTAHEPDDTLFSVDPSNVSLDVVSRLISLIFSKGNTVWIHNAAFDIGVLRNEGFSPDTLEAEVLDTKCISWLLEPEREGGHGLKSLVPNILGKSMSSFDQFKLYTKNSHVPVGLMGKYAIDDAVFLLELAHRLYGALSDPLKKVLHDLEMPIMKIVEEMQHYGFKVDVPTLSEAGERLSVEIKELEEEFTQIFGPHAKIGSSQWLSKNLCGSVWGLIDTSKDQHSTASEYMQKWAEGTPEGTTEIGVKAAKIVLRHRKISKLVSTYCTKLVAVADDAGRVHGNFNQWGTGTGRMSSSSPNMQNIPSSRTTEGDLIRRAFIPASGYKLIVADYSQIELRVTAHLSNDPIMSKIYQENGDIHQMTADACDCARFDAKAINFGLIYKMGASTLSKAIGKTEAEAQDYIDKYFDNYKGVAVFQQRLISSCRTKGYTWTVTGRKRPLKNINHSKVRLRSGDERKAINTQVQGSAADIIKIGMRNFWRRLRSEGLTSDDFRVIGQVHDEVVVEVKEHLAERVSVVLQHEMENCVTLSVPLIAEPCIGSSWGDAK